MRGRILVESVVVISEPQYSGPRFSDGVLRRLSFDGNLYANSLRFWSSFSGMTAVTPLRWRLFLTRSLPKVFMDGARTPSPLCWDFLDNVIPFEPVISNISVKYCKFYNNTAWHGDCFMKLLVVLAIKSSRHLRCDFSVSAFYK